LALGFPIDLILLALPLHGYPPTGIDPLPDEGKADSRHDEAINDFVMT
jgi:hypothetical protein